MPPELPHSRDLLSVSEVLNALEIDCAAAGEPETYLVVPGNSGPRWLIPAKSRASAQVLRTWRPYSISSKLKWLAVRTAARARILQLVPFVSSVTISRTASRRWLESCGITSRGAEMVILVGNPSPFRKLIVFLLDGAHRIVAVLKVGLTAGGGASVLHEAETLGKLGRCSWAPKILSVRPGLRAAAQEYVHGSMPDLRFRTEYLDLLCQFPRTGSSRNLADLAEAMASSLSPFRAEVDKIAPGLLGRSLNGLALDVDVPTLLVHGDFVPWNIRHSSGRGNVLVDWEWANFAGLPGHDLFQFHFSVDQRFSGRGGGYAAIRASSDCAEYFRGMDLDAELLPRLAIACLLDQLNIDCKHEDSGHRAYTLRQLAAVVDALGPEQRSGEQS